MIFLDETMNNLAASKVLGVFRLVREVREPGEACAFITHGGRRGFQAFDRVLVMRRVEVLADARSPRSSGISDAEDIITSEVLPE
ncbi:MAG: hypothetical protein F4186_10865 [Boseongicola sp. SB0676_bin_33]|nr:hypothetical protein [Boseongicola sp. SB0676_bin_33]